MLRPLLILSLLIIPWITHAKVSYHIEITNPHQQLANISNTFPVAKNQELIVKMPVWRTGRYEILNFASAISDVNVVDQNGKPLNFEKTSKSTWRIQAGSDTRQATITYELYANELGLRTRHIDETHGFFDASATFLYSDNLRSEPLSVSWNGPKDWKGRSGLESSGKRSFRAKDFDQLIDSPIEIGIHEYFNFKVEGKIFEVVIWGQGNYDKTLIQTDLKKIVKGTKDIWGSYPFERYLFKLHLTDGQFGATEHINSTIIDLDRHIFKEREQYLRFVRVAAHEFIHTWNVKAYRPEGIAIYDYDKENYSKLLWLSEGSTSYFEDLILLRAGVITLKEFLKKLAQYLEDYKTKPGNTKISLTDYSFNYWMKSRDRHKRLNRTSGIYLEGKVFSLLLDLNMLAATKGKASYQDVHRKLYEDFRLPKTFSSNDVKQLVETLSPLKTDAIWSDYVDGRKKIDVLDLAKQIGLEAKYGGKPEMVSQKTGWLGIQIASGSDWIKIDSVAYNSPAWNAGLTSGDHIAAINGFRVTSKAWKDRLKTLRQKEEVTIDYYRRGRVHQAKLTAKEKPRARLSLVPTSKPSPEQKALFEAWTRTPWPEKKSKSVSH
ncbi:MAG: M61 family metallopeptidase [Pseudobacteriovorax sp.]|nr:M61 family metallopeptidase [Pseudobacteriovorax sp.]